MTISILITDDHRLMRQGLARLLNDIPEMHVCGEAENGSQAIEMVGTVHPDIVLLDIGMPVLNGIDTARSIATQYPETRVVALTAHTEDRYIIDMLQARASGYLTKNASIDELVTALRVVHSGGRYLSTSVASSVLDKLIYGKGTTGLHGGPLSTRERQVLQLLAEGKSSKDIAAFLKLSLNTVIRHRQNISDKLGLTGVAELTRYAIREGISAP